MDLVDLIVEQRDAIKKVCAKYGATAVRIFGSCARDDYDEESDIDILVEGLPLDRGWGGLGRLYDIEHELTALLGCKVDVWTPALLNSKVREKALKDAFRCERRRSITRMVKKEEFENWIHLWLDRAAMAYEKHMIELSKQALLRAWEHQKALAQMEGSKVPEQPQDPELFFRTWTPSKIHEAAERALPDISVYIARQAECRKEAQALQLQEDSHNDYPPDYFVKQTRQALEQYLREKDHTKPKTET